MKTSRIHKIIRHCVDQTGAQKVVFVGPFKDVVPYLSEKCVINMEETDLVNADVLVYVGNNPVERADLVESARVVIIDESDSHDRNISIDRGNKKVIHLETHHGRQYSLDRSYPPVIVYTHVDIEKTTVNNLPVFHSLEHLRQNLSIQWFRQHSPQTWRLTPWTFLNGLLQKHWSK